MKHYHLGNRYESGTGLYDSHARHYDAKSGRFLSKDPVRGRSSKPQSLNPYACSLNNPQRFPDPSGLVPSYDDTQTLTGSEGGEGEDFTGQEEDATSPEEEASGEDCSQYVPENAQAPNGDVEGTVQENISEQPSWLGSGFFRDVYFANEVRDNGAYDYKGTVDETDPLYEDYATLGNFNYGATGAALGYDEVELQQAAGVFQAYDNYNRGRPMDYYFDQPSDAYKVSQGDFSQINSEGDREEIEQGYDYYYCLQ